MINGFREEGDFCSNCFKGYFYYIPKGDCSCHKAAPCTSCENSYLKCNNCGYVPEEPEHIDVPVAPSLVMREYKPKPLDKTKIDFRIKMHTGASQIKEGVYPIGTKREDVEKVVRGSFGGRFEFFENGKFKYIAYTD